jgi:hypothetical protein
LSSLRVIDSVESSICEEERRSNPDEELYYLDCFAALCSQRLAVTQGVIDNYFVTVNFFVTVPSSP